MNLLDMNQKERRKMSSVTYTTFNNISGKVITRSVQTFVPGLYSVTSETDSGTFDAVLDGSEVLSLLNDDMRMILNIEFKSKALPSQSEGFSFYPIGIVANESPVIVAFNKNTNKAFTTTLDGYHEQRED